MTKMLVAESESKLFKPSLVYRPMPYPEFDLATTEHERIHWMTEEAELSGDVLDWRENMSPDEIGLITNNLAIFTAGDIVVAQNYKETLIPAYKNNAISNWLTSVANRESEHQRAYALANEIFGLPESYFGVFEKFKEMSNRLENMSSKRFSPLYVEDCALATAQTTFSEGVGLMGAFSIMLNFNRFDVAGYRGQRGRLKGFAKINKWSLREESLHADNAALLHKLTVREHQHIYTDEFKKTVYDMAREFYQIECVYIDLVFKEYSIPTIDKESTKAYIRFMINRRLLQLGYKKIFDDVDNNPFPWMEDILRGAGGRRLEAFFETRVDNYALNNLSGDFNHDTIMNMLGRISIR